MEQQSHAEETSPVNDQYKPSWREELQMRLAELQKIKQEGDSGFKSSGGKDREAITKAKDLYLQVRNFSNFPVFQ